MTTSNAAIGLRSRANAAGLSQQALKFASLLALLLILPVAMSQSISMAEPRTAIDLEHVRRLTQILETTRLTFEWKDRKVSEALGDIARVLGRTILVDPEIRSSEERTITLGVTDLRASSLLSVLADQGGFVLQFRHGLLHATTKAKALSQSLMTVVHDIREHLYVPPDFPAPNRLGLNPGRPMEPEPEAERATRDPSQMVEVLRQMTGGTAVWDQEGVSLVVHGGMLVVRHSRDVQRSVAHALQGLRGAF